MLAALLKRFKPNFISSLKTSQQLRKTTFSFSTKQSKYRSLNKVEKALPKSPKKSTEVIKTLVKKFDLRIQMKSTGWKKKTLNHEAQIYFTGFLNWPDMTLTNTGMKDVIYVGESNGISQYNTKHYLLWSFCESLNIINTSQEDNFKNQFKEISIILWLYKAA